MQVSNSNNSLVVEAKVFNPATISRILGFLVSPTEMHKYRLVNKDWAIEAKKLMQLAANKLRKEIMSFRKDITIELTERQETMISLLLPTFKEMPQLYLATPFFSPMQFVELKAMKHPLQVCFSVFLAASSLLIDSDTWNANQKKWSQQLFLVIDAMTQNTPKDTDFYLNIPKDRLDNAEKYFSQNPFTLLNAKKASAGTHNLGKWFLAAFRCGKLASKLNDEAKNVVKELVSEVADPLLKEFAKVNRAKECCECNEVREHFKQRIEDFTKKIEEQEKRVREKDIEILTLRMAAQNLAIVMKEIKEQHQRDKIQEWKDKKTQSKQK